MLMHAWFFFIFFMITCFICLTFFFFSSEVEHKRDDADIELEADLDIWMVLKEPSAPVVLIVDDQDYIRVIRRLRRHGFALTLVRGSTSAPQLNDFQPLKWLDMLNESKYTPPLGNLPLPKEYNRTQWPFSSSGYGKLCNPTLFLFIFGKRNISLTNYSQKFQVFWDLLTCPLPTDDIDPSNIRGNIEEILRQMGYPSNYKIKAFVRSKTLDPILERSSKPLYPLVDSPTCC